MNVQVYWRGPVGKVSGLGIASKEYVRALARQGVRVKLAQKTGKIASGNKRRTGGKGTSVLIYHFPPNRINIKKERKKYDYLILNTVWETTRIPRNWFPAINRFDAVCVPSKQNKRALINSGVKVPIFIVPHGVNTRTFHPANRKLFIKDAKGRFVFVSVFGFQHRKNPETLLRAYWNAFTSKDKVLLAIKTFGYRKHETQQWIHNQIRRYRLKLGYRKSLPPITLLPRYLSFKQIPQLYTRGNVFVLPTRGEGVGLPFLEALASGIPVIATGWGGHMDFLTKSNSFLIPYKLLPPAKSMNNKHVIARTFRGLFVQRGQLWAEVTSPALSQLMKKAYKNPALCKKKGKQGRRDMLKHSWNRSGLAMKRAILQVVKRRVVKRSLSLGVVTHVNDQLEKQLSAVGAVRKFGPESSNPTT
ncbi:glycosyltransferase family 4 protein [Brevibacillus ginsengisoli]|uniref:glycosyltransferase family 4 protein n=1 Tax=Brevibacillus ginsengisoli TaxID=363854 RepID=UPI003CF8575B